MKNASFNVRCSKELKERLQAIAIERKCSVSDVIIDFVSKSIASYECDKDLQSITIDANFDDY